MATVAASGSPKPQSPGPGAVEGQVTASMDEEAEAPGGAEAEAEELRCPRHCAELSARQNEQRRQGLFCDVTLAFGEEGREFRAHRSILAAATDYFCPLMSGHLLEARSGRKWSSETGPDMETVEGVIQYMYTGSIHVCTCNVQEVLELADRYWNNRAAFPIRRLYSNTEWCANLSAGTTVSL